MICNDILGISAFQNLVMKNHIKRIKICFLSKRLKGMSSSFLGQDHHIFIKGPLVPRKQHLLTNHRLMDYQTQSYVSQHF